MLTGTLVTAAGFLPVGLAKSAAGEYTFSIFAVVTIALLVSWLVAVLFTPYLGYKLLPDYAKQRAQGTLLDRWVGARLRRLFPRMALSPAPPAAASHNDPDIYNRGFYRRFRAVVTWCVSHRRIVIGVTVRRVRASHRRLRRSSSSSSSRPPIAPSWWSICGFPTARRSPPPRPRRSASKRCSLHDPDIESYVAYIGGGSPRFYLPLDQQLNNANFAEFVVTTKSNEVRERVARRLLDIIDNEFTLVRGRVNPLQNGPPVAYPVQFRVSGPDYIKIRQIATQVRDVMRAQPEHVARPSRLERALQSRAARDRPEQGALDRRHFAGFVQRAQLDADGLLHHTVSRARQADRGAGARRAERSV